MKYRPPVASTRALKVFRMNKSVVDRPAYAATGMAWACAALLAAAPAVATGQAPGVPTSAAGSGAGLDCLIQPSQTVQVGTATAGVVDSVRAERGDYVTKGQVLLQLQNSVERAALSVAREKAVQLGEVRATRSASDLAKRELQRAQDLVKDNFVSRTYYDRQRAELEVASGRGQQAEERRSLAQREVELASAQLAQRTVHSPVNGVVVERYVSSGEYVEQKPVMRIAQVDPLRVDVLVPASAFGQVAVGSRAMVTPELLNLTPQVAVVSGVDRVIDAASHTFRVRLELKNPGGKLPPGLRCKAELLGADGKPLLSKERPQDITQTRPGTGTGTLKSANGGTGVAPAPKANSTLAKPVTEVARAPVGR